MNKLDQDPNRIPSDLRIHADNFGGLNVVSSPLNIPAEDSPNLLNVDVDLAGNVSKRQGTVTIGNSTAVSEFSYSAKSVFGYNFLITKSGTSLLVARYVDDVPTIVRTFVNVFTANAGRPHFSTLSDLDSRILILTGSNAPVHVNILEQRLIATSNAATVVFQNAQRFEFEPPLLFVNGVVTVAPRVYNPTTKTLTYTLAQVSGNVYDVVAFNWQWWAESLTYFGDRFYDATSRFNVSKADQSIAIPKGIRSDISPVNNVYGSAPIQVYKGTNLADIYPFSLAGQPGNADTFGFGDGSVYNIGANQTLSRSPIFATFGDTRLPLPQPAETAYFIRQRELRFNGGTGVQAQFLEVLVDGAASPKSLAPGVPFGSPLAHVMLKRDGSNVTAGTDQAFYVGFNVSQPIGVSPTSVVKLTNIQPRFIGSAALSTSENFRSGTFFRVYGLGLFADYNTGDFPSTASLFQGRLALSGFFSDTSRVVVSGVTDVYDADFKYTYFQITDDLDGVDTDPFDVIVTSSQADDFVNGLAEWQNSLFILTRRGVFRVYGGDAPVTSNRIIVSLVSSIGNLNPRTVARTDVAVYYVSDSGIHTLNPRVEDGEYLANEVSIKIRTLFSSATEPENAWMSYDLSRKLLYVGLSKPGETSTASRLLVYNLVRTGWTVYDTPGGFNTTGGTFYSDDVLGDLFCLNCRAGTSSLLVRLYGKRYVDFLEKSVIPASTNSPLARFYSLRTASIPAFDREFSYEIPSSILFTPYNNVQDFRLTLNGLELAFGTQWFKRGNKVFLASNPGNGTLVFTPRCPVDDSFEGATNYPSINKNKNVMFIWVDNIEREFDQLASTPVLTLPALTDSVYESGQAYPSYFLSPLFPINDLKRLKKVKDAYVYLDNRPYSASYKTGDLNQAVGQLPDTLVGAWKVKANVNLTMTYDGVADAERENDIYGFSSVTYGDASFDFDPSNAQAVDFVLFKERLVGAGYNFQFGLWSFDNAAWTLSGYQIDARGAGSRYIRGGRR